MYCSLPGTVSIYIFLSITINNAPFHSKISQFGKISYFVTMPTCIVTTSSLMELLLLVFCYLIFDQMY